jgi:transglutaminase 1
MQFIELICDLVARCIGIPSRVITNYQSAHDTHSSITVDRFFDEEGEPIKDYNTDSIWNFHSWNEVWITRPGDLKSNYY